MRSMIPRIVFSGVMGFFLIFFIFLVVSIFSISTQGPSLLCPSVSADLVDVDYHPTKRHANMSDFGDFSETESVGEGAQKMLEFLMGILGGIALLAIIIAGGMIMLGGTDETMLERGKDVLKYTAIGVLIAIFAVTLTTIVQTIFYSVEA